tara:strand:- start:90 stop:368 length:279 start_codon:yes stop_codon:yes gene_type:complete
MQARLEYTATAKRFMTPSLNKEDIHRMAVGETRIALIQSKKFDSVIGSILLAIAVKLVTKLIEKWLDENLFSLDSISPQYTEGEPGYDPKTK